VKAKWKEFPLEFLNGALDTRSPSGTLDFATWRLLLNVDGKERSGLCRMGGFRKYLGSEDCFLNADLHDQLLTGQTYYESYSSTMGGTWTISGTTTGIVGYGSGYDLPIWSRTPDMTEDYCGTTYYTLGRTCKESITLLHSFSNATKDRKLIAATKSRVYVSDESGSNWRILADGLGGDCHSPTDCTCSPHRFTAASLGNTVLLANGTDYVLGWENDTAPAGCASWSAEYVQELLQLNIDSAEIVQSWSGFAFLAGIRADGEYLPGRLIWSDYNDPYSWIPGQESNAGFHDFGAGERILVVEPIGGRLRVYTSQAIYDLTVSANADLVFNVQEIYRGPHVPIYRFSVVNTGKAHFYLSEDTAFVMAEYDREPTSYEWLHRAVGVIYNGLPDSWVSGVDDKLPGFSRIDRTQCNLVTGGFDSKNRAVWWSWVGEEEGGCPFMSMVVWPERQKASLFDHGFTAFTSHRPDLGETLRDFLGREGLCDPSENLIAKQGAPCDLSFTDAGFTCLWNATEDPSLPMDEGAFFEVLCDTCIEDLCLDCDTGIRFLMASATDKAIKEYDPTIFYREMLATAAPATFPEAAVATYTQDGYTTLIQGDAYRYKSDSDKVFRQLSFNFVAAEQTVPSNLYGEAGYGMQPDCLQWEMDSTPIQLDCVDNGQFADGQRQGEVPSFNFFAQGSFLAYRVWVTGTGGQFCAASLTAKIQAIGNCW